MAFNNNPKAPNKVSGTQRDRPARLFRGFSAINVLFLTLAVLGAHLPSVYAETIFTYRAPEHEGDTRYEYDNALLRLALDKTVEEYGPYKMVPSPVMNFARATRMAEIGALQNFMYKQSYEERLTEILDYVPIPVDRGIVGYRVFFVSTANKEKIAAIKTLEELKKHTIVLGPRWHDIAIFENAGFKVKIIYQYESLFPFVARGRGDLLCRGANELLREYQTYQYIKGLTYDENLLVYYPLPRFFWTTKGNTEAIARVTLGLKRALDDGSFVELWEKKYRESIDFLNLKDRRMFVLENPGLKGLDESYKQYMYDPLKDE